MTNTKANPLRLILFSLLCLFLRSDAGWAQTPPAPTNPRIVTPTGSCFTACVVSVGQPFDAVVDPVVGATGYQIHVFDNGAWFYRSIAASTVTTEVRFSGLVVTTPGSHIFKVNSFSQTLNTFSPDFTFTAVSAEPPTSSSSVTLAWDASPSPEVVGYTVAYGNTAGTYTTFVDAGPVTQYVVPSLPPGTYHFAVRGFTADKIMTEYSNEVSTAVPVIPALLTPSLVRVIR